MFCYILTTYTHTCTLYLHSSSHPSQACCSGPFVGVVLGRKCHLITPRTNGFNAGECEFWRLFVTCYFHIKVSAYQQGEHELPAAPTKPPSPLSSLPPPHSFSAQAASSCCRHPIQTAFFGTARIFFAIVIQREDSSAVIKIIKSLLQSFSGNISRLGPPTPRPPHLLARRPSKTHLQRSDLQGKE